MQYIYKCINIISYILLIISVDGGYSEWGEWNACTVTCGIGSKSRTRDCDNPVPDYGGANCSGDSEDIMTCNETPCPGLKEQPFIFDI